MSTTRVVKRNHPGIRLTAICTVIVACWAMVAQAGGGGCPADLNRDSHVDVADLIDLLNQWGSCPPTGHCPGDLTGNGEVGVPDLIVLLDAWGKCPMEGGCVGYCGRQSPYGWCDEKCVAFGDCVWNACAACDIPNCDLLPDDSCQYHCDGMTQSGCWCDDACCDFDDCCDDMLEWCDDCPADRN